MIDQRFYPGYSFGPSGGITKIATQGARKGSSYYVPFSRLPPGLKEVWRPRSVVNSRGRSANGAAAFSFSG